VADPTPIESAADQAAIDELLKQASMVSPEAIAAAPASADSSHPGDGSLPDQASIEELLRQATFEDPSVGGSSSSGGAGGPSPDELKLPNFSQVIQDAQVSSIDLLKDVELNVKIELGRSRMLVEDVLRLSEGSVVELDKLAGDPVDVFVNDRLVARGEVLVLNDNFCVRVNEIVTASKEEGL
jgi:flagellar motor switch protein FliN/FliY